MLGDAFLCYPPYAAPRLNVAFFCAIGIDVPLLCFTPCTAVGVSATLFLAPITAVRAGVTRILRSDWALLWRMVPFLLMSSLYTASWRGFYHH